MVAVDIVASITFFAEAAFLRLKIYVCVEITVIGSWTGIVGAFKNYLPQICGAFWHGLRAFVLDNTF